LQLELQLLFQIQPFFQVSLTGHFEYSAAASPVASSKIASAKEVVSDHSAEPLRGGICKDYLPVELGIII